MEQLLHMAFLLHGIVFTRSLNVHQHSIGHIAKDTREKVSSMENNKLYETNTAISVNCLSLLVAFSDMWTFQALLPLEATGIKSGNCSGPTLTKGTTHGSLTGMFSSTELHWNFIHAVSNHCKAALIPKLAVLIKEIFCHKYRYQPTFPCTLDRFFFHLSPNTSILTSFKLTTGAFKIHTITSLSHKFSIERVNTQKNTEDG